MILITKIQIDTYKELIGSAKRVNYY